MGLALGLVASFVIRRTEDPLAEIMATTALAFASFVAAEQLHVSGAIAGVTAGLTVGVALRREVSPQSQVAIHTFWEYAAFGVNTFLFLSVGLTTRPGVLLEHLPADRHRVRVRVRGPRGGHLPALPAAALAAPHGLRCPLRWQHVFLVGNIKGALSIGLVLGLPENTPVSGAAGGHRLRRHLLLAGGPGAAAQPARCGSWG